MIEAIVIATKGQTAGQLAAALAIGVLGAIILWDLFGDS